MKKILLVAGAAILATIILAFVLIPSNIVVSKVIYTDLKPAVVLRCLRDDVKWHQWFPGTSNKGVFVYNDQKFHITQKAYSSTEISIKKNDKNYNSVINVIAMPGDSSAIQWQLTFKASNNFIKRIIQYQTAKSIKEDLGYLLDNFKKFTGHTKNIYGFDIKYTTLTDTAVVSIKTILDQYPSTIFIYNQIDQLKKYIASQHAAEHNLPMLNITPLPDKTYDVMIGIPVNIPLKGNDVIKPKRMIMLKNKTLITEVTGDTAVIQKALEATSNYMSDNELSAPVIPFQQLVTDRRKEKDSTKWLTRIFSPII